VTVGLDGAAAGDLTFAAADDYAWATGVTIDVATPGLHTLSLWMQKDGAIVDRIALATDPAFRPDGVGPAESLHVPPMMPPDGGEPGGGSHGGCGCRAPADAGSALVVIVVVAALRRRRAAVCSRP